MLAPPKDSKGARSRSPSPHLHRRNLSNYDRSPRAPDHEKSQPGERQTRKQQWCEERPEVSFNLWNLFPPRKIFNHNRVLEDSK